MLVDSRAVEPGSQLDADLCIIGAGAAGIAIAREWIGSKRSVVLLESGGFDADPATQALTRGEAAGNVLANPETYLSRSRLRYFGGSTNHWGGVCRPLGAIDFEPRPWVSEGGWPFGRATLDPYYARARQLVEVPHFDYAGDASYPKGRLPLWRGSTDDSGSIDTALIHFSPPTRFGQRYRQEIVDAPDVALHLRANAVELETDADGARLESVRVARLDGAQYRVRPRVAVLATGGVENARMLLASNRTRSAGLGNDHDRVGRYFMDHLALDAGAALFSLPSTELRLYRPGYDGKRRTRSIGLLSISEAAQREQRLLGFSARLRRVRWPDLDSAQRSLMRAIVSVDRLDAAGPPAGDAADALALFSVLDVVAESSPRPDSRVTLTQRRDALGLPLARVDWRVAPSDYASISRSLQILATELGMRSQGRVRPRVRAVPDALQPRTGGWSHHMGTTRMHVDARQGVVDADCRVHSVPNLFVAGSSVFPCSGPEGTTTLTLLALSLRLSDRIRRELAT